jgi:hypothetical protein
MAKQLTSGQSRMIGGRRQSDWALDVRRGVLIKWTAKRVEINPRLTVNGKYRLNLIEGKDLKVMNRQEFLKSCACGICCIAGIGMIAPPSSSGEESTDSGAKKSPKPEDASDNTPLVPVDQRQITNVLRFIDSSMDESVKKEVFAKLGCEHTTHPKFIEFINESRKDLKGYFDRINSGKDTYWEKIEYIPSLSCIRITGKKATRCACPYAQCDRPPKSLCNYCCVGFQKAMFETMLQKKVRVQLDESYLLGGKRCSTTIYVDGKLDIV